MLRAVFFDFDGTIVDSEPLIMRLTQQMAAQEGWTVTDEEYYRDYLALDDRRIIEHLYESHGRPIDHTRRDKLVQWKMRTYAETIKQGLPTVPGSVEFVRKVAAQFPLAIASGSLRSEIEHLLATLALRDKFAVLTAADDCERCKPDPEVYLKALEGMRQLPAFRPGNGNAALTADECLAVEDAPGGVHAAQAAGMKCLAVASSRPVEELRHADWAYGRFSEVDFESIQSAFKT